MDHFVFTCYLFRKRDEAKKKMFISFNFGGQVVSVVTGSEMEKKNEEENEERKTEPKKKTYDSDSDSDVDVSPAEEAKEAVESKGEGNDANNNGVDDDDDDFVDDELEAEFIENEEFCPVKPKNVPFGVAANLSITAPVYHTSGKASSEATVKGSDDDPFSTMNDKDRRSRVQHDYFAD